MEKNMFSINENQYKEMTDEKLIENIKQDDNMALNCLLERYNDVVNMKANKFFMVGAEREDMVQEGMIGLYKAVKSFDTEKQNSFKTFANMCIERQLITAVKNSNRQKHIPLNSSISLNSAAYVSEIVRAGIEAVDKGQMEAARSLGMKKSTAMMLIVIPQAVKNILPAIGNEFVAIIKESSMASIIGVNELMFAGKVVVGSTYLGLEPYIVAAGFYFIMTFTLGRIISLIERRMKKSDSR